METLHSEVTAATGIRSKAPVFVIGCGRSGTTLLYHMLLSSGNFAVYRTESNVINLLEPRFGNLRKLPNQRRLLEAWYDSRLYTLSGLDKGKLEKRVTAECQNGGDFLRIIMEEMCRNQGVERWADTTPEHLLHLPRIKETIPDALIIHMIRDGRDVALSTAKLGYIRRLPWDRTPNTMVSGLYWEWMVDRGRKDGQKLGKDYMEVRFEELVNNPQPTLAKIGSFIQHELNYDRIRSAGIGSVSAPNSSFDARKLDDSFNPVGRWCAAYSSEDIRTMEALIGSSLERLGYQLSTNPADAPHRHRLRAMRRVYRGYFDSKLFLKAKTPLGALFTSRDLSWI
jgi:Sulfotransferase family